MVYSFFNRHLLAALIFATAMGEAVVSANPSFSILASPFIIVPVALESLDSSNDSFEPAFGGSLGVELKPGDSSPLLYRVSAAYSGAGLLPVEGVPVNGSLSEISLLAGAGFKKNLHQRLGLFAYIDGGLVLGSLGGDKSVPYGSFRLGTGIDLEVTSEVAARLEGSWTSRFGLYSGPGASLGVRYNLPTLNKNKTNLLSVPSFNLNNVFPMFKSFYDDQPLGTVLISNIGRVSVKDIRVQLFIRQYMDAPKECGIIKELAAGDTVEVPLFGLFNDSILTVTEATKASAEVTLDYGNGNRQSWASTVLVYDRNALTWSDDRHAAAFVSSKDPWVLDLTGNIMAAVMPVRNPEVPGNMQTVLAIHEGLKAYGISYLLSPNRPFAKEVVDTAAVDSLKFPRQTLGFRSGDCADLSVLYASCYEAAGMASAFITVPGHIFVAVDLGISASEARGRGMNLDELIFQDDKVWLPLETTIRNAGFREAWREGAAQWRKASVKGAAVLYPVHEAWRRYPPVGLPADGSSIQLPRAADVLKGFEAELAAVVNRELSSRIDLLGPLVRDAAYARGANDRGVLYAKYGFYPRAIEYFKDAAQAGSSSALVNLGNILMLQSDPSGAYRYYKQAIEAYPRNAKLQANLARAAAALGKSDEAEAALQELRSLDPQLADQYAVIVRSDGSDAQGVRASAVETGVFWF